MKRLFGLSPLKPGIYFETKQAAKAAKDKDDVVILGPDHWRYGVKGNPKTHSHNAHSGGSGDGFRKSKKQRKAARSAKK